jgi:hypothetical protein
MKILILASARPPQVLAACAAARDRFTGAEATLLVPAKNIAAYSDVSCRLLPQAVDFFAPPAPAGLAGLGQDDLVIGVLNNHSGHDADDLIRLLLSLPTRRFLFTFDGRLLCFDWSLRLRWFFSRLWSR